MMLARWLDKLVERKRALSFAALVLMVVVVIADIATPGKEPKLPWDAIGGFAAVMGFLGCVFFIALAKGLGSLLYRPEDYYGEEHEHEAPPADDAGDGSGHD